MEIAVNKHFHIAFKKRGLSFKYTAVIDGFTYTLDVAGGKEGGLNNLLCETPFVKASDFDKYCLSVTCKTPPATPSFDGKFERLEEDFEWEDDFGFSEVEKIEIEEIFTSLRISTIDDLNSVIENLREYGLNFVESYETLEVLDYEF